ncbi:hypothetical protein [Thermococcus prieurii]
MKFRLKESIGTLSRTCRKVKGIIHRIRLADIISLFFHGRQSPDWRNIYILQEQ